MTKKIYTVLGARPQFIKAKAVSEQFLNGVESNQKIEERIVHTGQHFDDNMSDSFFRELKLPKPFVNLGVSGGGHGDMTGNMMIALEELFRSDMPDGVIVYGDTNSTLAGALVAAKLHIPVFHIEAGLRSFNTKMPEEINRVLTDKISTRL